MFDEQFHSLGSFTDPNVATEYPGYTVFQVENVEGKLFVTFATMAPPYGGVVDIFDTDGNLLTPSHFTANAGDAGPLVNPWGIAKAPAHFGKFSQSILIGNVDDGRINSFDLAGNFLGTLQDNNDSDIVIPGLWDMVFEEGDGNRSGVELYFNAGPDIADFAGNGLFGIITVGHQE
jgi:uncharacterized protein (TIGR03118 family)